MFKFLIGASTIVLFIGKIFGLLNISWWIVMAPVLIYFIFVALLIFILGLCANIK